MESCPSCGKDSPGNSLHCVQCGAKLASAAQKTQFGMPVLRPADTAQAGAADDGEKSTAEYAPQDLARLAMATKKTPGSALAGLGSLKTGRRPGSLLQGLPQFRGSGQSPLTSGEFRLGAVASESSKTPELGLYAGAKRSSLPPEVAPSVSNPPEEPAAAEEPPATVAMQGVTPDQIGGAAEPDPTVAMQGVSAADQQAAAQQAAAQQAAVVAVAQAGRIDATVEERKINPSLLADAGTDDLAAETASKPVSEAPLPAAMRGSERADHPASKGVQQARIDEPGSGNAKWIIIALIIAAGIGIGVWLTRG